MIDRSFDSALYTGYSHALTFAVIDSAIAQFVVTPRADVASVAAADADRVFASSRDPFPVRFAAVADTADKIVALCSICLPPDRPFAVMDAIIFNRLLPFNLVFFAVAVIAKAEDKDASSMTAAFVAAKRAAAIVVATTALTGVIGCTAAVTVIDSVITIGHKATS